MFDPATRASMVSTTVAHLHFFRHGAVEVPGLRTVRGQLDVALSVEGVEQTKRLTSWAREALGPARVQPPVRGVIASDLRRTRVLGEALASVLDVPLVLEPALREQSMGRWEGLPWQTLNEQDPAGVEEYWTRYLDARPGGGESVRDLGERVARWWDGERARLEGERWAIVAHIGVIRIFLVHAFGLDLSQTLRFTPDVASHTHLLVAEAGPCVATLGERPWLGSATPGDVRPRPTESGTATPLRLALSGSAGTGKTTLARHLAARLGVPYVPEGMRERLERGLRLDRLRPHEVSGLVGELFDEQQSREAEAVARAGGFVADRSPLDFLAFWLYYGCGDGQTTRAFYERVRTCVGALTRLVVLPWGALPLVADGVRSSDPWRQRHYQALVEGLVLRYAAPERVVWLTGDARSLEARVEQALAGLPADVERAPPVRAAAPG